MNGHCRSFIAALAGSLCLAGLACAAAAAEPTPPAAAPASVATAGAEGWTLARDPTSRLTLAVTINGQGPFDFLVDTGADRTVIARELAASLGLPGGRRVVMNEITGVDDVKTVVIDHLAVGDRRVDHIEAPALAESDLGAAGILGIDALRNLHVVMDFKAMRMSSSASRAEPADFQTVVVRGDNRFGQLILANARIRGADVLVVLDSGSQLSVGNPALLRLLTGRGPGSDPRLTAQIVGVTGRSMTVEVDPIAEAHIGGLVVRNIALAFAQLPIFDRLGLTGRPALLLGMDVLSLCRRVSVDLRRREATFTLN